MPPSTWWCRPDQCGMRWIATSRSSRRWAARVEDRRLEICLTANDRKFASELLTHHDRRRMLVAIGIGGRAASREMAATELRGVHRAAESAICSAADHCVRTRRRSGSGGTCEDAPSATVHSERSSVALRVRGAGALRSVCGQRQRDGASGCRDGLPNRRGLAASASQAIPITPTARRASLHGARITE